MRREDLRLLRGEGQYVADLQTQSTLHLAFVRSSVANARIERVDLTGAQATEGVVLALSGRELAAHLQPMPMLHVPQAKFVEAMNLSTTPPLVSCVAVDRTRYVGEPVALVVAESRHVAEDAAEAAIVDYDALDPVLDLVTAQEAAAIYDECPGNVMISLNYAQGTSIEEVFEHAAVTVEEVIVMGRHGGVPLECRGAYARFDARVGRVDLYTSTQTPHIVRDGICKVTGWTPSMIRVVVPDVGGGFGPKANFYAEEALVALVSRMVRGEVAWIEDRSEHLTSCAQGRDQRHVIRLAVAEDGFILGWEDDFLVDLGAANPWAAGVIGNTAIHLLGPYRVENLRVSGKGVVTNKAPTSQYRGAGRPEACFALERMLDFAADRLGISRWEIRRRNLLSRADLPFKHKMPYRDGVPIEFDGGDYLVCFDRCVELLEERRPALQVALRRGAQRLGFGIANYIEATGRGPWESARVWLDSQGDFVVSTGAASAGQGHETTLALVAAEVLQVDPERIRLDRTDTAVVEKGYGTYASRSAIMAGSAVHIAASQLAIRARRLAAKLLDVKPSQLRQKPSGFTAPDRGDVTWMDFAEMLGPTGRLSSEPPLAEFATFSPPTVTWTMGTLAVAVEVEVDTGIVRVLDYIVVHEGSRALSESIVDGQVRGGVAQGFGGALLEEFLYDEQGQPQSTTFADYLLPSSCDVPTGVTEHLMSSSDRNPLKIKGVGESGTIPAYAAVAAAVEDALGDDRRRNITSVPVTPRSVFLMLEGEGG